MSKTLVLQMKNGNIVKIARSAHIGRALQIAWAVPERPVPVVFGSLELVVMIDSPTVSRNHCAILARDSKFFLVDMHSANGTKYNNFPLVPGEEYQIDAGGVINIGGYLIHVAGFEDPDRNNHALLVGATGGNLRGVRNDIALMKQALEQRKFTNITVLLEDQSTKNQILAALDTISKQATNDSSVLIYFSGHGSMEGLSIHNNGFGGSSTFTPKELFGQLANIRGNKIAILDCCHAGTFIANHAPPDVLVIAATKTEDVAYEEGATIIQGQCMGILTKHIVTFLRSTTGGINMGDLRRIFSNGIEGKWRMQQPVVAGPSQSLSSIIFKP